MTYLYIAQHWSLTCITYLLYSSFCIRIKWKVQLSKCAFSQTNISYLCHIISAQGVATDPTKFQDIQKWRVPTNTKELRSFLGLASFYCKFVHHFATICKSLTELLKKHTLFVWTSEHQQAFETLKHALISAPVLALPDFSSPFCIYTDACHTRVVAILHIYRCRKAIP